jgi:hypothetical protein
VTDVDDIIAREIVFGQKPGKDRFPITIEIGRPFPWGGISPTEYGCYVKADPLLRKTDFHGEGALQALCLALQYIRWQLDHFIENGGILLTENGEEFRLQSYWPNKPF